MIASPQQRLFEEDWYSDSQCSFAGDIYPSSLLILVLSGDRDCCDDDLELLVSYVRPNPTKLSLMLMARLRASKVYDLAEAKTERSPSRIQHQEYHSTASKTA